MAWFAAPDIGHVDAPLDVFRRHPELGRDGLHVSAHVARAPVSEPAEVQDHYVASVLRPALESPAASFASIGFHLNGPYAAPLGRLGLGSDFVADPTSVRRAHRFFDLTADLGLPVLIENANFYDGSPSAVLDAVQATNQIARDHDARLILDVAHLRASAHNHGLDARLLLGHVDLPRVALVHLSGVTARGGLLHDGHDKPVDDETFALLEGLLPFLAPDVTAVVEHTDASWAGRPDELAADLDRTLGLIGSTTDAGVAGDAIDLYRVGAGYLNRFVVPHQLPALAALDAADRGRVVTSWVETVRTSSPTAVRAWDADIWDPARIDVVDLRAEFIDHLHALAERTAEP